MATSACGGVRGQCGDGAKRASKMCMWLSQASGGSVRKGRFVPAECATAMVDAFMAMRSVQHDGALAHHLAPLGVFLLEEGGELGRRRCHGLSAQVAQALDLG